MIYTLGHAQYPAHNKGGWWKQSRHWTIAGARRAAHRYYAGKWGWCYSITDWRGREVYSSDHELAEQSA